MLPETHPSCLFLCRCRLDLIDSSSNVYDDNDGDALGGGAALCLYLIDYVSDIARLVSKRPNSRTLKTLIRSASVIELFYS